MNNDDATQPRWVFNLDGHPWLCCVFVAGRVIALEHSAERRKLARRRMVVQYWTRYAAKIEARARANERAARGGPN